MHRDFDNVRAAIDWLLDAAMPARRRRCSAASPGDGGSGRRASRVTLLLRRSLDSAGATTPYAWAVATMWAGYIGACAGLGMEEGAALRRQRRSGSWPTRPTTSFVEMDRSSLLGLAHETARPTSA